MHIYPVCKNATTFSLCDKKDTIRDEHHHEKTFNHEECSNCLSADYPHNWYTPVTGLLSKLVHIS